MPLRAEFPAIFSVISVFSVAQSFRLSIQSATSELTRWVLIVIQLEALSPTR